MSEIRSLNDPEEHLLSLKAVLDAACCAYAFLENEQTISTALEGTETGLGARSNMVPTLILKTEAGYLAVISEPKQI